MWYAINVLGIDGLRAQAHESWRVAAYAVAQLQAIGWPSWRHPNSMTVVLDTPPPEIAARWRLASSNGQSHIITVPGVTTKQIDAVVGQLALLAPPRRAAQTGQWPTVPAPRTPAYTDGGTDARH